MLGFSLVRTSGSLGCSTAAARGSWSSRRSPRRACTTFRCASPRGWPLHSRTGVLHAPVPAPIHERSCVWQVPSAALVSGIGEIAGTPCMVIANDSSLKGGTMMPLSVKKQLRAQVRASARRRVFWRLLIVPLVGGAGRRNGESITMRVPRGLGRRISAAAGAHWCCNLSVVACMACAGLPVCVLVFACVFRTSFCVWFLCAFVIAMRQAEIFADRDHGGRCFYNEAVMSASHTSPQVACGPCVRWWVCGGSVSDDAKHLPLRCYHVPGSGRDGRVDGWWCVLLLPLPLPHPVTPRPALRSQARMCPQCAM